VAKTTAATTAAANKKKKIRRNVTVAVAHIKATFNNTTVTVTDTKGDTLCWASAGTCGFKGSRKSTPFAGQCAAQQAAEKAAKYGVRELEVRVKGPGSGRESAITALQSAGMTIKLIEEALDRVAGKGDWEFGACPLCVEEIEAAKKPGKDGKKPKPAKAVDIWIPKARLEYLPWARYCVRHQETEERNREIA